MVKLPTTLGALLSMSPAALGIPGAGPPGAPPAGAGPGAAAIKVDPAKIPKPEAIRALLTPGASAVAVDDQFIRFTSRYAFPEFATLIEQAGQAPAYSGMLKGVIPGMPADGTPPPPARGNTPGPEGATNGPGAEREVPRPR
jgi:hypothetical protein